MMMPDFSFLIPELVLTGILLLLLIGETIKGKNDKPCAGWIIAVAGCLTAAGISAFASKSGNTFNGMFISDSFSSFFKVFFSLSTAAIIPMSREFFQKNEGKFGEFLLILIASLLSLFFLVSSNDLLLIFLTLETFTLSLYILAAYLKKDMRSIESGIKYLIMGSIASAFVIYGIALIYTASGTTTLAGVREYFLTAPDNKLMILGILLIVSGLGFKIASVPFQFWVPDVYEGAPAPVTAYLAVVSKSAGFALLLRLTSAAFGPFDQRPLFAILSALTLVYGNLGALAQTNIKRLFGYSSIGHAGYLMMGIASGKLAGTEAVLYYLTGYAFTSLCAFWVITLAGNALESDRITDYRGLTKRSPLLAGAMFIALLSLAGVPPLAGFTGKFLVLYSAVQAGLNWLVVLGALGVVVSLYYYLSIVRVMYFEEPKNTSALPVPALARGIISFLILGIILIGFWQAPFWSAVETAAKSLF